MYIIVSLNLYCLCIFAILENFQKLPGGMFIAARRHMYFYMFWVLEEETPGGTFLGRQATHGRTQCFPGFMKGMAVTVELPGDANPLLVRI